MRDPAGRASKTKRKQDASAVQALGHELTGMKPALLARVPLGDRTREAIDDYRSTKTHEARRRQLQRIGKLMRDEDEFAIRIILADMEVSANGPRCPVK